MERTKGQVSGRSSRAVVSNTTTIIDGETGEIKKITSTEVGNRESEPPFVKLYINDISRLIDLAPATSKLLYLLIRHLPYNNMVAMYKPIKDQMCKELNLELSTLNNSVNELAKKGILLRQARGLYVLDPDQFGRGSWHDIKKIRMTVEYDEQGRKSINTQKFNQLALDF